MDQKQMESIIEGILFTFGEAVEPSRIAKALEVETKDVVKALEHMKETWAEEGRGVQLTELDGSYQMCTKPELYEYLIRMAKQPRKQVLTDVLLETLSIIAYKQPITKSEIEKIRGVSSDHAVSKLVEYSLVTELGRLDAPEDRCFLEPRKNSYVPLAYLPLMNCRRRRPTRWRPLSRRLSRKLNWM